MVWAIRCPHVGCAPRTILSISSFLGTGLGTKSALGVQSRERPCRKGRHATALLRRTGQSTLLTVHPSLQNLVLRSLWMDSLLQYRPRNRSLVDNSLPRSSALHTHCPGNSLSGIDPIQRRIGQIDAISRIGNRSYREYCPPRRRGNSGFPMKAREIGWIRKEEI